MRHIETFRGGGVSLYLYRCPVHGEVEVRKPMAAAGLPENCPICYPETLAAFAAGLPDPHPDLRPMERIYTPPITDCKSFGRNVYGARTPQWRWKPTSEDQARQFRDIARRAGARTQFGAGRTSGS